MPKTVIVNALKRELSSAEDAVRNAIANAPHTLRRGVSTPGFLKQRDERTPTEAAAMEAVEFIQAALTYYRSVRKEYELANAGEENE